MNYRDNLLQLSQISRELEEAYIENGGEITAETEKLEAARAAVAELLLNDVDELGRWHKAKEDQLAAHKAEKAAADARIKADRNTIDYIKGEITRILKDLGKDKVKGSFYGYTAAQSNTTSCDNDRLNADFAEQLAFAAKQLGVPGWVDIKLSGKVSNVPEGEELPDYFHVTTTDTVRFSKPREISE